MIQFKLFEPRFKLISPGFGVILLRRSPASYQGFVMFHGNSQHSNQHVLGGFAVLVTTYFERSSYIYAQRVGTRKLNPFSWFIPTSTLQALYTVTPCRHMVLS